VRSKWVKDKRSLPLTRDHWELYRIIHRMYWRQLHDFPDLVACRDFNDRMQWLKLFDQHDEIVRCSDKILVRDYIRERVGTEYLTELYQVCDQFEEIDFCSLPKQFVIKTNHDSGTVILVRDKHQLNLDSAKTLVHRSLNNVYGVENGEWAYSYIRPRILVEQFIDPKRPTPPPDYKFYVVEGRARFVHYIYNRWSSPKEQTVDAAGNNLETALYPSFELGNEFQKPLCWQDMLQVAEQIGKGFKFVRVDLFCCNEKIYAGEMTFWPAAGIYKSAGQKQLGQLLDFNRSTFAPPIIHRLRRPCAPIGRAESTAV
jgi:hypothetical protein